MGSEEAFFLLLKTLEEVVFGVRFSWYLVKGRYCTYTKAIKFIEVACKNGTGGDENQVRYFIWPKYDSNDGDSCWLVNVSKKGGRSSDNDMWPKAWTKRNYLSICWCVNSCPYLHVLAMENRCLPGLFERLRKSNDMSVQGPIAVVISPLVSIMRD